MKGGFKMSYMVGIDVGGTFTDFSIFDTSSGKIKNYKLSSSTNDPSIAIINGINDILEENNISANEINYLAHGTTVATNALIEKKGSRIGLITTKGFKDLMEIKDQRRPSLYDLLKQKPEKLIPSGLVYEVDERILYNGDIKQPINEDEIISIVENLKKDGVDGIAVCTLFSFINNEHELKIKEIINKRFPEAYVTISSDIVREFREYQRMSTAVLNTYIGPVMKDYVLNFKNAVRNIGIKVEPYVTQSNGSVISITETISQPIKTALSGPSAGVVGSAYIGKKAGFNNIITFDMGGTSADISLIENSEIKISHDRLIEEYPARIPMIDINAVGAGGGSIAYIDSGGALKVGPKSAGAIPGPACYMKGGLLPTVTDANITLGKLNQKKILGGKMEVSLDLAREVIKNELCSKTNLSIEDAAAGIISVVNSNMIRAIRVVSVEKGHDVRNFVLMAYGGAGPLHACEIAKELGIKKVIFPLSPGTLCSLGLLIADSRFDFSVTKILELNENNLEEINSIFKDLKNKGDEMLDSEGIKDSQKHFDYVIECRYERQNYEIPIEIKNSILDLEDIKVLSNNFHEAHNNLYGYYDKAKTIQLVNFRLGAIGEIIKPNIEPIERKSHSELNPIDSRMVRFEGSKNYISTKIYDREELDVGDVIIGPAIIEQMDSTSVIPPAWEATVDEFKNLVVEYKGEIYE